MSPISIKIPSTTPSISKIGFAGAQGVGKTTLVQKLLAHSSYSDFSNYKNYQRIFSANLDNFKINKDAGDVSQSVIAGCHSAQLLSEDKLIFDRTLADVFAYSDFSPSVYNKFQIQRVFSELFPRYDVVFYIPVEFDVTPDGVRSIDKEYQRDIDNRIKKYLDEYKVPYVTLTGSVEERFRVILDTLNNYPDVFGADF